MPGEAGMVNEMELYLMSFIEGYLGPEKAYKLRNKAYTWRFKDAWRYGMMHRNVKRELESDIEYSAEKLEGETRMKQFYRNRVEELEASLKCECQKNELAKKYIETLIHPV